MNDVLATLESPIKQATAQLAGTEPIDVSLERPADPDHGDYATSIALRLARTLGTQPRTLADQISRDASTHTSEATFDVAGPGFINLRLKPAFYQRALEAIHAAGEGYGAGSAAATERVLVELVSANPTGDLPVSGARNGAYGDAVARLLRFAGAEVTREYYFNDAGGQIDRFVASIQARKHGQEPPDGGYPGREPIELATLIDLPADASIDQWRAQAVPMMITRIRRSLERLRIAIDIWFSERELHASGAVERGIERARKAGHVYEADGATWLRTSPFGDDKDRVIIRSDGTTTYFAADIAYLEHKFSRGHQRLIYVLGPDHHGYIARLRAAASCLGYDPDAVEVSMHQVVTVSGQRMGKRRGNVVTADELLDTIGADAARYFLVSRSHDQAMDIDLDLAARQERENPVYYVQYAHARCCSILRKAGPFPAAPPPLSGYAPEPQETTLIKRLVEWPAVARTATARRAPHTVVAWMHALAGEYHVFQHDIPVLRAAPEARRYRLALVQSTQSTLRCALGLVGVDAPQEM